FPCAFMHVGVRRGPERKPPEEDETKQKGGGGWFSRGRPRGGRNAIPWKRPGRREKRMSGPFAAASTDPRTEREPGSGPLFPSGLLRENRLAGVPEVAGRQRGHLREPHDLRRQRQF